jgi:hypothetical protein
MEKQARQSEPLYRIRNRILYPSPCPPRLFPMPQFQKLPRFRAAPFQRAGERIPQPLQKETIDYS